MYVCVALLWLSICVLLCIVYTNEYYMYFCNARKGPWLENKTFYSILFYSILVYEQRSLISAFVFLNLNNIMDIQVQILMSKV